MPNAKLHLKRTFSASREKVFDAWVNPEKLKQWFHVADDWKTHLYDTEIKQGAKYRIGMEEPDKDPHVVIGEYHEIDPPNKLVFTWAWEINPTEETLVTLLFHDKDGQTEMELIHERFATEETAEHHSKGWNGCLAQLEHALI